MLYLVVCLLFSSLTHPLLNCELVKAAFFQTFILPLFPPPRILAQSLLSCMC